MENLENGNHFEKQDVLPWLKSAFRAKINLGIPLNVAASYQALYEPFMNVVDIKDIHIFNSNLQQ